MNRQATLKEQVSCYLPPAVREIMDRVPAAMWEGLEEIRLRLGKPLAVYGRDKDCFLSAAGEAVPAVQGYRLTREDLERAMGLISNSSLYAFEQELRCGYLTIPGGHRVGLCGRAVVKEGRVAVLTDINGLNYRLAREVEGAARRYVRYCLDFQAGRVRHTLIVSPPRGGKTTFLRDLTRWLSDGIPALGFVGFKLAVVDERSEIAGCYRGEPQLNVGCATDVLDACPKAEGMMMLLRAMGPQVIVTDEIGGEDDVRAIEEVLHAGVTIVATAHGNSLAELRRKPGLRKLLDQGVFERVIFLGRSRGVGTVERIVDPARNRIVYCHTAEGEKEHYG